MLVLVLANLASCSLELVSIAPGPPDAEEDERGSPRRKAATTIDTATAEEDVKDCDCACASSRTCLQRAGAAPLGSKSTIQSRNNQDTIHETIRIQSTIQSHLLSRGVHCKK